jgi:hypothetical protein
MRLVQRCAANHSIASSSSWVSSRQRQQQQQEVGLPQLRRCSVLQSEVCTCRKSGAQHQLLVSNFHNTWMLPGCAFHVVLPCQLCSPSAHVVVFICGAYGARVTGVLLFTSATQHPKRVALSFPHNILGRSVSVFLPAAGACRAWLQMACVGSSPSTSRPAAAAGPALSGTSGRWSECRAASS